jgi:hypothetical protein
VSKGVPARGEARRNRFWYGVTSRGGEVHDGELIGVQLGHWKQGMSNLQATKVLGEHQRGQDALLPLKHAYTRLTWRIYHTPKICCSISG